MLMIMNSPTKTNPMLRSMSSLRSSLFRLLFTPCPPFRFVIYIYTSQILALTGVNNDRRIMYFGDSSFSE